MGFFRFLGFFEISGLLGFLLGFFGLWVFFWIFGIFRIFMGFFGFLGFVWNFQDFWDFFQIFPKSVWDFSSDFPLGDNCAKTVSKIVDMALKLEQNMYGWVGFFIFGPHPPPVSFIVKFLPPSPGGGEFGLLHLTSKEVLLEALSRHPSATKTDRHT